MYSQQLYETNNGIVDEICPEILMVQKSGVHQLRLAIFTCFSTSQVVIARFLNHQQYVEKSTQEISLEISWASASASSSGFQMDTLPPAHLRFPRERARCGDSVVWRWCGGFGWGKILDTKKTLLLSIESWLVNRDLYNGLL